MRKTLSLLFIAIFLLNSCGYYFLFLYNQSILRDDMHSLIRSGILKNQCVEIVIRDFSNNKDFNWLEKDEFRYKGCMYDVVSCEIKGTTATFICINDAKEAQLIARHDQYRNLLASTGTPDRSRNTLTLQSLLIKHALVGELRLQAPSDFTLLQFHYSGSELKTLSISPKSPPPRFS